MTSEQDTVKSFIDQTFKNIGDVTWPKKTNTLRGYGSNRDIEFQKRSHAAKGSWTVNMDIFCITRVARIIF